MTSSSAMKSPEPLIFAGLPTEGEVDHLGDGDLEFVGIVAEQLHRRLHAGDIAVVSTPDVEEEFRAGELVAVIGDVGRKVEITVALDEGAILVVAELGRQSHTAPSSSKTALWARGRPLHRRWRRWMTTAR